MTAALGPLGSDELEVLKRDPRRVRLPTRHMSLRAKIYYPFRPNDREGIGALSDKVYVTVGFDDALRAREIFARGGSRHGDTVDFGLDSVAIALSVLLQIGEPLERLAELAPSRLAHYLAGPDGNERQQLFARTAIAAILHAAIQLEATANMGAL